MKCPFCLHTATSVIDSRESSAEAIRRRRVCDGCDRRFTTYERIEAIPLVVLKKDGTKQDFSRAKVFGGILRACEKRPVTREQIEESVNQIEASIRKEHDVEVTSKVVGNLVVDRLKELDHIAYVRFASVYKGFKNPMQFAKEVEKLKKLKVSA